MSLSTSSGQNTELYRYSMMHKKSSQSIAATTTDHEWWISGCQVTSTENNRIHLFSLEIRMGCCDGSYATSASVKVAAPLQVVWDVITDIDAYPSIVREVVDIRRIPSGSSSLDKWAEKEGTTTGEEESKKPVKLGSQFYETRQYDGQQVRSHKTVTVMDKKSFSLSMNFPDEPTVSHTSTLSVERIDDQSCLLIGTFALVVPNIVGRIWLLFIGPCVMPKNCKNFEEELESYAAEARRRYAR